MGEELFETLARALATPMPRRRAVRLVGASLVALSVPGMRPRSIRSAHRGPPGVDTCATNERTCLKDIGAEPREYCCPAPAWNRVCGTRKNGYACKKVCQETKKQFPCETLPDKYGWTNGVCCIRKFGNACDPRGPRSIFKCKKGTEKCRNTCCPKGTYCCGPKNTGVCCDKKKGSCCNVGARGKPEMMCCTEPSQCATQADRTGTAPRDARQVCCPEDRVVPFGGSRTCCPPGYLSLGGKLVQPAGGEGGLCCRSDKVCGSGKGRTCCSTGTGTAPELEQICCGSTCVNYKTDPRNCGACGTACAPGQTCENGVCS